jgi:hypothetical protein
MLSLTWRVVPATKAPRGACNRHHEQERSGRCGASAACHGWLVHGLVRNLQLGIPLQQPFGAGHTTKRSVSVWSATSALWLSERTPSQRLMPSAQGRLSMTRRSASFVTPSAQAAHLFGGSVSLAPAGQLHPRPVATAASGPRRRPQHLPWSPRG